MGNRYFKMVAGAQENYIGPGRFINGGFFLLSPSVGDLISGDETIWEHEPIEALVRQDQLRAFRHNGFWHPMDTLRERKLLEEEWATGAARWRIW